MDKFVKNKIEREFDNAKVNITIEVKKEGSHKVLNGHLEKLEKMFLDKKIKMNRICSEELEPMVEERIFQEHEKITIFKKEMLEIINKK